MQSGGVTEAQLQSTLLMMIADQEAIKAAAERGQDPAIRRSALRMARAYGGELRAYSRTTDAIASGDQSRTAKEWATIQKANEEQQDAAQEFLTVVQAASGSSN